MNQLGEIAIVFLRLGTTAFGGPAAHIALMEDEIVRRRAWMTRAEFLDYLGATNLIPGPNSTEMAIHVGQARAGWRGLIVAGVSFIAPAAVLTGLAAWAYVRYGALPELAGLLYGIKPVVIAVIAQAIWALGRTAVKTTTVALIGAVSALAVAAGAHELAVLGAAGLAGALWRRRPPRQAGIVAWLAGPVHGSATGNGITAAAALATPAVVTSVGVAPLFLVFLKIGSVLFGSGYVLVAFLRADLVERLGWITEQQLIDATAIGLVTPGPVFTAATFIGYLVAGTSGAVVATTGIFLPAFVFVAMSGRLVPRLRRSPIAAGVLDGVNVASLALMALVSLQLGRAALVDPLTYLLAAVSVIAIVHYRVNPAWLLAIGACVGLLVG